MKQAVVFAAIFLLFAVGGAAVNKWLPPVGYSAEMLPSTAGADYEACFEPDGHCTELVERAIASAKHTIAFEAYALTNERIVDALNHASTNGVQVRSVIDRNSEIASWLPGEVRIECDVRIHHSKVLIIDDQSVSVGSYNFTHAAAHNRENLIWLRRPDIAAVYLRDFEQQWAVSIPGIACPVKQKRRR